MNLVDKILALEDRIIKNELTIEQAKGLLSSKEFKPFLSEDILVQLDKEARRFALKSSLAASLVATLAYEGSKVVGSTALQAICGFTLGCILSDLCRFRDSIPLINQALRFFRDNGLMQGVGPCFGRLGIVYWHLGEYSKAMDHYKQALKTYQDIGDQDGEGMAIGGIGTVCFSIGDYFSVH